MDHLLETPIVYLKGVGPKRADLLKSELNIFTFKDLIEHYPFRYVDKSKFFKITDSFANMRSIVVPPLLGICIKKIDLFIIGLLLILLGTNLNLTSILFIFINFYGRLKKIIINYIVFANA